MSFILVSRNPSTGKLLAVVDDDDRTISEFDTREEAEFLADKQTMCQGFGYQVVEID